MESNRAVISVVGKDQVGIIADVTAVLKEHQINVLDISQTILQDFFTMMMLVDLSRTASMQEIEAALEQTAANLGLTIHIQREDLFKHMHRI
ncbi:ACT domain-containing protein [Alkalicoccus luteus]|uniref:UPF0237 protein HCN83_06720 n=1 Tax=Alkalicoccus luteus TaxID=1237094 RepID=A0A969PST0_9BACI|nr:ACT domain-containing protein [Alkalicoccus luteus]NJP37278.1 ACT domain-containing protein [Alkalicoccus luteus]